MIKIIKKVQRFYPWMFGKRRMFGFLCPFKILCLSLVFLTFFFFCSCHCYSNVIEIISIPDFSFFVIFYFSFEFQLLSLYVVVIVVALALMIFPLLRSELLYTEDLKLLFFSFMSLWPQIEDYFPKTMAIPGKTDFWKKEER